MMAGGRFNGRPTQQWGLLQRTKEESGTGPGPPDLEGFCGLGPFLFSPAGQKAAVVSTECLNLIAALSLSLLRRSTTRAT